MLHAPLSVAPAPTSRAAVLSVLSAMALVVTDAALVNVALPTIANALDVTPAQSVRLVSAYQAAVVMALLPAGALGESLGYRRVFTGGLLLFIAASAFCAVAPSLNWLVAGRFLQGLGAAAVMALGIALLRQALPPSRLTAVIGWNALTVALCSALGPAIGATIVAFASWQWLFVAHLPVALVALATSRWLPPHAGTAGRLDAVSLGLSATGFALLVFGLESIAARPLAAALCIPAGIIAFTVLIRRERANAAPVVPIDLLRERPFRLSVIASVCCFAGQTSGLLALPFYLQRTLGETALTTGLFMTAWPAAVAAGALASGRLANGFPSAPLTTAGGVILGLGLAGAALLPPAAPLAALALLAMLCGIGFGLFQVPNNRNMFLAPPPPRAGAAGGAQGTARLLGQTLGAITVTLLFGVGSDSAAIKFALGVGAAFAFSAACVSGWQSIAAARRSQA